MFLDCFDVLMLQINFKKQKKIFQYISDSKKKTL